MADEYLSYMKAGQDAAWQLRWGAAVESFTKALQIRPDDLDAHVSLGLALLNSNQLERALKVYRRAIQLAPDDPEPLERTADILERMGQLKEAAVQYVKVADLYLQMRDLDKAIRTWVHATELTPGLVSVHLRLAQAYERIGDKPKALREYLVLAYNFRRLNDMEKAIKAVERALKIDPRNALALNSLRALQAGGEIRLPDDVLNRKAQPKAADAEPEFSGELFWTPDFGTPPATESSNPLGPMGDAMELALETLAASVVELGLQPSVMPALKALEDHRQGNHTAAIESYTEAERAGLRSPALQMCLGGLLVLEQQAKAATQHLGEAMADMNLISGATHGLGLAYRQLRDQQKAARFLIQTLQKIVSQMDEFSLDESADRVYITLGSLVDGATDESLVQMNEQFAAALSGENWHNRVRDMTMHLMETLRRDGPRGLIDILTTSSGESGLPEIITTVDRYIRQGLYTLAMDEAHSAVEVAPYYLPAHIRMAEILMKEGRIRQAIMKYNVIARAYMTREENDRAAAILTDVLKMAPLDIEVRQNLIELLEQQDRMSDALNQYIDLAHTYQQLGDFERASQTFAASERLARRINAPTKKIVEIKHAIAEINQMRLNTRQVQKVYEEILELAQDDERALRGLVDINYNQGNTVEAVKRLDALLGVYAAKGTVNKIIALLSELVEHYPRDMALRARLASIYRKLGQPVQAIEQLDALGELQLEAGMNKDAANTIRQIIALKPDRVEEYKKLLSQLE
jgi:tetratricopeptide (TPR) repeat protein